MLYTIGHSNHTSEALQALLAAHRIEVVADVRSAPYSKYSPQFNRETLAGHLGRVRYAFMGDSLGGRPAGREYYDEAGHVLYGPLSRSPAFLRGLEQLEKNAEKFVIALLCSEADPAACHRFLLITRCLRQRGFDPRAICHILGDGTTLGDGEIGVQGMLLEDSWRSPQSVSQSPALSPSSGG